jgi:5-methyltetrahydrofolate--homocysteine methyltransferase
MHDLKNLHEAILTGEAGTAKVEAERALAAGMDALQIVNGAMMPAMNEVGRRFETEEYFVPDLLLAARAMKAALEPIRPLLVSGKMSTAGCVVIGTVKGDLHEIGKNLVAAMLEGNGFEVVDLGVDVSPERFVSVAQEKQASIVALSALLTTTMGSMKATVEAIHKAGLKGKVKVLVGGAPISQAFADTIGADGFSDNAVGAVALARRVAGLAA